MKKGCLILLRQPLMLFMVTLCSIPKIVIFLLVQDYTYPDLLTVDFVA